jgi:drug/metabolite transporter (DMT)-like permease
MKAALRMTVFDSIWLSVLFMAVSGFSLRFTPVSFLLAAGYSTFAIVCTVASLFAFRYGKVANVSLFLLTGGLILPVLYGVVILGESLNMLQGTGIILIMLSFFCSAFSKEPREKNSESHRIRCLLLYITVFVCNGMISIIIKAHSVSKGTVPEQDFLITAALLRLMIGLILISIITLKKQPVQNEHHDVPAHFISILPLFLIVGGYTLCNGIANFFSLITAKTMDSSVQFPVISATVVLLTALISWAVYKEKPTFHEIIGMAFTLAGIVFMINQ